MEEIKDFVYNEVIFRLEKYYNVLINERLEKEINNVIDEEYENFVKSTKSWEPEPYIEYVVNKISQL